MPSLFKRKLVSKNINGYQMAQTSRMIILEKGHQLTYKEMIKRIYWQN